MKEYRYNCSVYNKKEHYHDCYMVVVDCLSNARYMCVTRLIDETDNFDDWEILNITAVKE